MQRGWTHIGLMVAVVVVGALAVSPSVGQDALERLRGLGQGGGNAGNNPPPAQGGQNNVLPQIPNAAGQQKLLVPDWVKPGLRVVYRGSSSIEAPPPNPNRQPGEPMNLGSAAIGLSTFDVKAVTDTFMIVGSENYLTDINTNTHDLIGTATFFANQQTVMVGGAFFIHPDELAKMQSGDGVEVVRGPFPINGQNVEAVTITVRIPDSISQRVFDAKSGLKLVERISSGPLRQGETVNEFNRKSREMTEFVGIRQIEGPWNQTGDPDWARQVRTMQYEGQMVHSMAGFTQAYPMRATINITERGEGWSRGTNETVIQLPNSPPQPANKTPVGQGAGTLGGLWMHPQALAAIQPGVVDQDPHVGSTLTYQTDGQLGVFILQSSGGARALTAYNLNDGCLVALRLEQPKMHQIAELQLTGRQ